MSRNNVTAAAADREQWLRKVALALAPKFEKLGYELPKLRIGVGFPSTGRKSKRIGECWASEYSADQHHEIFLHPSVADSLEIAATLAHELCHTAAGIEAKHGQKFKKIAVAIGLEGPMRATTAGEQLRKDLQVIVEKIGDYPHAHLDTMKGVSTRGPKQKGRMLKAMCPECKYIIRASKSCLEIGVPPCPNPECSLSYQQNDKIIPMIAEVPDDSENEEN